MGPGWQEAEGLGISTRLRGGSYRRDAEISADSARDESTRPG